MSKPSTPVVSSGQRRIGRRPGTSGTRDAILNAARTLFADQGYGSTSIREIAGAAGVDPGLIRHFFGNKDDLFAAALDLPPNVARRFVDAVSGPLDGIGERYARMYFALWDDAESGPVLRAIFRSGVSSERGTELLGELIRARVLTEIAPQLHADRAGIRTSLAGCQLIGIAIARYIFEIEPLATMDSEELVAMVAPTLQRYLAGDLGSAG